MIAWRYISSLNPTIRVFPLRIVGARKFPVGPSNNFSNVDLSGGLLFRSKRLNDFPFATKSWSTSLNRDDRSRLENFTSWRLFHPRRTLGHRQETLALAYSSFILGDGNSNRLFS